MIGRIWMNLVVKKHETPGIWCFSGAFLVLFVAEAGLSEVEGAYRASGRAAGLALKYPSGTQRSSQGQDG